MDPVADIKGKEVKRCTLNELVDYITGGRGVLTDPVYPEIIRMVNSKYNLLIVGSYWSPTFVVLNYQSTVLTVFKMHMCS